MNEEKINNLVFNILTEFNELLESHNIQIPNEDREGNKEEASLYGTEYYNLEEKIKELIRGFVK